MAPINRQCRISKEIELNGCEAPDKLQIYAVTQHVRKRHPEKPKPTCCQCKKPSHYRNQCHQLRGEKDQGESNRSGAGKKNNSNNSGLTNSNPTNKNANDSNANNANNRNDRKSKTVYPTLETCGKTNHSTEILFMSQCSKETTSSE